MAKAFHGESQRDGSRQLILAELGRRPVGREVDLSTICFVREKTSGSRRVHFVRFKAATPRSSARDHPMRLTFFLATDDECGWKISSYCGGADRGPLRSAVARAYLGGGEDVDGFFAAGYVNGAGAEIERVELRFADGKVIEDRPENDIVLFVIDGPVQLPSPLR